MKKAASRTDKKQTMLGLFMLALFAMPFAAAGLGILLFMTAPMVYDWARMQTWHSVPAQVEAAKPQAQQRGHRPQHRHPLPLPGGRGGVHRKPRLPSPRAPTTSAAFKSNWVIACRARNARASQ